MDEPADGIVRMGLTILYLAAAAVLPAGEPEIEWLPQQALQAAGLRDDEPTRGAARSLLHWWMEPPDVTAPSPAGSARPDQAWVAVHVFSSGGEAAFANATASGLTEAAPLALRAARRATEIAGTRAVHLMVFLGQKELVIDERMIRYADWTESVDYGRAGFLCFDGQAIQDAISPFHVLRRNALRFRPLIGMAKGELPDWVVYTGRQFHLDLSTEGRPAVREWLRGKPLVPLSMITRREVAAMAHEAAGWLLRNVDDRGRLPYQITLTDQTSSVDGENELRQWMASRALIEAARREGSAAALAIARRNVESNLKRFYRDEDDYGVIERGGEVKLGAASLAALALREFPGAPLEWREKEERLERLISFLWRNDGSFRSFLRPRERADDNQNFYSGEALLYWATRLAAEPDEFLRERFLRSAGYYHKWHLARRNPAFVPWHTMALGAAWPLSQDTPEGSGWVFAMNDWLLRIQEVNGAPRHPDTAGRFYAPGRGFGPPHASSTGVYLEGLCAALKLARLSGETERSAAYAAAIRTGLREARQLQYSGPADWLDLTESRRLLVQGAFRTTEYDRTIRCDNVQHLLQACWRALDLPDEAGIFVTPNL